VVAALLLVGCRAANPDFVILVNENAQVVQETNGALLDSINKALSEQIPQADRDKLIALKERLEWQSRSSVAIRDYINEKDFGPEVLKELIKTQWQKPLPKGDQ
jgi:deoxyxylulose-5-phosphate synthase